MCIYIYIDIYINKKSQFSCRKHALSKHGSEIDAVGNIDAHLPIYITITHKFVCTCLNLNV